MTPLPSAFLPRLLAGGLVTLGLLAASSAPASAATSATFANGVLSVNGDSLDNNITVSRDAAGMLLVNGGATTVIGGSATVANTTLIRVFGLGGNDTIALSETNGALPRATLYGSSGNDVLTGGSGSDQLFGQAGNDTLLGKGGSDLLFGGNDNDTITGGDADDQAFGQAGTDRMVWNPGDDTDLNEGGTGTDTVEVNGGNGAEQFTTTANGTRVRFDRLNPAPFSIDIGTSETLVLNANGGDDSASATGNLAALIAMTTNGGAGNDTLLGSNGIDVLLAGDGTDFVDGQQGNDTAFLGAGDDTFQWDPGDGSDVVEGQDGQDTMLFNGSAIAERMEASANGGRVRFTRDVGGIVMDVNDTETILAKAFGGTDTVTTNDLSGTDVVNVIADLAVVGGGDDLAADNVVVNSTGGDDAVTITGASTNMQVTGVAAAVTVSGGIAGSDRLTVNGLVGDDVLDGSALPATTALLTLDGGDGSDVLLGGDGNDTLLGGNDDDVLLGGAGADILDGGAGDNVVIQALANDQLESARPVGQTWLKAHPRIARRLPS